MSPKLFVTFDGKEGSKGVAPRGPVSVSSALSEAIILDKKTPRPRAATNNFQATAAASGIENDANDGYALQTKCCGNHIHKE